MNPWESPDIKTRRRHAYIGYTPDRSVEVPYPWQFSEFEVQAKLYARLIAMGLAVLALDNANRVVLRVAFFCNKRCRNVAPNVEERREPNPHSRQYLRYTRFNAELIWHSCHQDIQFTCERVRKAIEATNAKGFV